MRVPPRAFAPALLLCALAAAAPAHAARDSTGVTTVILVRHAEKSTTLLGHDVPLSTAGQLRALDLANALGQAGVDTIVVTPYQRTRQTAMPLAARRGDSLLEIDAVDETVRRIRRDLAGLTVLVVGHSNTLPAIIDSLTGRQIPAFEEGDFARLYVVTLAPGRPGTLVRLGYGRPMAPRAPD